MQKIILLLLLFSYPFAGISQNYTSYFTGNAVDVVKTPLAGICMMGGATEYDEAMRWFLQRSNGGDILVLRASGSDGYNDYLYSELGVTVNSVETIVFNNADASAELYVQQKIQRAEAIWFAGGDQWNYVSYWRNTAIADLVNDAIINRHIVIGGTSAGMAILGGFYFSAQNGSVTSTTALNNPYAGSVTADSTGFLHVPFLDSVITDTHYDNPDRRGRQTVFLARAKQDWNLNVRGIACDEYTALCIDENGIARAFGDYPGNDDNAYFIRANCEVDNNRPENCQAGEPLTWNQQNLALKVYNIKGTPAGSNSFNLGDWITGTGGSWQRWWVTNGVWQSADADPIACGVLPVKLNSFTAAKVGKSAVLQWQTETEINSSHFNIQKSADGILFETIGRLTASGNSNSLKRYRYEDLMPSRKCFYRLQMVDFDNNIEYSKIASLDFKGMENFIIYPNPSHTGSVVVSGNPPGSIWVMNVAGQKIFEHCFSGSAAQQTLNISGLRKGIYFLRFLSTNGTLTETRKLLVQ